MGKFILIKFYALFVLTFASCATFSDVYVSSKKWGVPSTTSEFIKVYLTNRNLVTQQSLLLEKFDFLRKRSHKFYIDIEKKYDNGYRVLKLTYENSEGLKKTIFTESYDNTANFERIEEIVGEDGLLLLKTYDQAQGASGSGHGIAYLYVIAYDQDRVSILKKIVLSTSGASSSSLNFYLSNMSGKPLSYQHQNTSFMFLESSTERVLYLVDHQNFRIETEEEYSLPKLKPSFSCQRVEFIERLICEESGISAMDNVLTDLYRPLKRLENVVSSQKAWLRNRNDTCLKVPLPMAKDCLAAHYQKRIMELIEIGKEIESP